MASLIKIGNSQGIRLPKTIIQQAHLEGANLEFEVLENGLLIKPIKYNSREAWRQNIQTVLVANQDKSDKALLDDLLDDSDLEDYIW